MDLSRRPLTRRPRAPIACNACRQTKSKCNTGAESAACERCERLGLDCRYSQNLQDRRLGRHAQAHAHTHTHTHTRTQRRIHGEHRNAASESGASNAGASLHADERSEGSNAAAAAAADTPGISPHVPPGPNSEADTAVVDDGAHSASSPGSDAGRVDVLAAGVFDHPSPANNSNCYLGPSSNFSLFWSLNACIANLGHRSARLYQGPSRTGRDDGNSAPESARPLPRPAPSSVPGYGSWTGPETVPKHETAVAWISTFFDTIGSALLYVHEAALLQHLGLLSRSIVAVTTGPPERRRAHGNAKLALLNIVFAHAVSTTDPAAAEPYYLRTLALMDPKTLYAASVELLQALLLLQIFQQNSQRSHESYTTHALAVKACYQLGVHAPSSYEHLRTSEKELRSRLWFATVVQDRMLGQGLGRPYLIPPSYVQMSIFDMVASASQYRTVEMQFAKNNLELFRHLVTLHDISGAAVETLCGSNIDLSSRPPLDELFTKTLDVSLRLERWRSALQTFPIISSDVVGFGSWPEASFESRRNEIIVSIYYYRTVLLIHSSLLMSALEAATRSPGEAPPGLLQDTTQRLLRDDLVAATELAQLIRGIRAYSPSFFKCNAVWWPCNYSALTLSLHVFAFWLASTTPPAPFIAGGHNSTDLEARLRSCLDVLREIGGSSILSVKAHRCLLRNLEFLKKTQDRRSRGSFGSGTMDHFQDLNGMFNGGAVQQSSFLGGGNMAVMFNDLNMQGMGNIDNMDLSGLDLDVPDFDAFGLY